MKVPIKREIFRSKIRREQHEEIFTVKRVIQYLYIPDFSTTEELHRYLLAEDVEARLQNLATNKQQLFRVIEAAKQEDYYGNLVFCNCLNQTFIEGAEDICIPIIVSSLQKQNWRLLNIAMGAVENLLCHEMSLEYVKRLKDKGILALSIEIIKGVMQENTIFSDDETEVLNGAVRVVKNLVSRFQIKQVILERDQICTLLFLCQSLLKLQLVDRKKKCHCLTLIYMITINDHTYMPYITGQTLKQLNSFLSASDNHLKVQTLKMIGNIVYQKNEDAAIVFLEMGTIDDIKRFMYDQDPTIRTSAYRVLANFCNCRSRAIQKRMGNDHHFVMEVFQLYTHMNQCYQDQQILSMTYGLLIQCEPYIPDELIQDAQLMPTAIHFLLFDENIEYQNLNLDIICTLVVKYSQRFEDKSILEKIMMEHKNDQLTERASALLQHLELNHY